MLQNGYQGYGLEGQQPTSPAPAANGNNGVVDGQQGQGVLHAQVPGPGAGSRVEGAGWWMEEGGRLGPTWRSWCPL